MVSERATIFDHPRIGVEYNFGRSVWLSVCQAITFESLEVHIGTSRISPENMGQVRI